MKYNTEYAKTLSDLLFERYQKGLINRLQLSDALCSLEEADSYFDTITPLNEKPTEEIKEEQWVKD